MTLEELLERQPPERGRWVIRLKTMGWDLVNVHGSIWSLQVYFILPQNIIQGPTTTYGTVLGLQSATEWAWNWVRVLLVSAAESNTELGLPLEPRLGRPALERVFEG